MTLLHGAVAGAAVGGAVVGGVLMSNSGAMQDGAGAAGGRDAYYTIVSEDLATRLLVCECVCE